jgi:hypothetical protein
MNWRESDFKVGIIVGLTAGAVLTYSVQHSMDDPESFADATDYNTNGTWLDNTDMSALTATDDGNYNFPIRAIRLNVTAYTSGSATMTLLQAT